MKYIVYYKDTSLGFYEIEAAGLYVPEGALVFVDGEGRVLDALADGIWARCTPVKGAYASDGD